MKEGATITFEEITYPNSNYCGPILKSISGHFKSGKLTGVLGSSGAGKTTLLNILAGHKTTNISGKIRINGTVCNGDDIKTISTYLMDDDLLQTSLTVKESMMFVAELKLDRSMDRSEREQIAINVLDKLNLNGCLDTMVENLSGGEKRRLSIALELISDPLIIFMDEPTSGLDEVSAKQCIELLKTLARSGKTIICTIHQPSNTIFNMFEHVYFMNSGYCIYDGPGGDLVNFLDGAGQSCPKTYSPADYILEISQTNEEISKYLNMKVKHCYQERLSIQNDPVDRFTLNLQSGTENRRIGFVRQTTVLLRRSFLQLKRRKLAMTINVAHHIICGLMTGLLYFNLGSNASKTDSIYKLSIGAVAYISFAYAIVPILAYPFQIKVIKREVTNGWYSLTAYFFTQSLTPLPYMIPLCFVFTLICFVIVDPSLSIERHLRLAVILIFVALVSHFYGHAIGALFNPKNSCVIGSMVANIAMNVGAFHHYRISLPTWLIRQTTFTRYGLVGCMLSFYQDRELTCPEIMCRHSVEKMIYDDYGLGTPSYMLQVAGLTLNVTFYATCFYVILRIKFYSKLVEGWRNFKAKYSK